MVIRTWAGSFHQVCARIDKYYPSQSLGRARRQRRQAKPLKKQSAGAKARVCRKTQTRNPGWNLGELENGEGGLISGFGKSVKCGLEAGPVGFRADSTKAE